MEEPIIIHCHIFKNAGSTFDSILKRNFGNKFKRYDESRPRNILQLAKIKRILDSNTSITAFSSHQLRLPLLPYDYPRKILPVIFIRHPIDRLASAYHFHRRDNRDWPAMQLAKKLTFKQYVEYILAKPNFIPYKDQQVRTCSRTDYKAILTDSDFENAKANLSKCLFVGSVTDFDKCMVSLTQLLKPYFPTIDLSIDKKRNVTPGRAESLQDRLASIQVEIGEILYRELERVNSYDIALYEYVIRNMISSHIM